MVFSRPDKVVVDMTVRYEQGAALRKVAREKGNKYRPLRQMLLQEFDQPFKIHGLSVGACGALCRLASKALDSLGIVGKPSRRLLSRTAMISSQYVERLS